MTAQVSFSPSAAQRSFAMLSGRGTLQNLSFCWVRDRFDLSGKACPFAKYKKKNSDFGHNATTLPAGSRAGRE